MTSTLQRLIPVLLVVCTLSRAPRVAADGSISSTNLQRPSAVPVNPLRVDVSSMGSVAVGCSLCRDSGNCSAAMNDTSSGVFCGDLHTAASTQPCCCAYYTECRITSRSQSCECGGAYPFTTQLDGQRHERLSATEAVNETEAEEQAQEEHFTLPHDNQMSASTEILIHLSAYLALFVFAAYVDQWVECFSDFRRNQMVAYGEAVDMKLLRFRQRFGKRRQDSGVETETDDNLPLLVLESPAPTFKPAFTFDEASDAESVVDTPEVVEESKPQEVVIVTVPVDVVQEVNTSASPESPLELEEIPLE